jgi:hypothetical protein
MAETIISHKEWLKQYKECPYKWKRPVDDGLPEHVARHFRTPYCQFRCREGIDASTTCRYSTCPEIRSENEVVRRGEDGTTHEPWKAD